MQQPNNLKQGLTLWPPETCLVTELAHALLTLSDESLRRAVVILPTRRLGTMLMATLATLRPRHAFLAPWVTTLDHFIASQSEALEDSGGSSSRPKVWDTSKLEILLARLLTDLNCAQIGPAAAHELIHFFNELTIAERRAEEVYPLLREIIAADIFRSIDESDLLTDRINEVERVEAALNDLLTQLKIIPAERDHSANCKKLASYFAALTQLPWSKVFIAGFTSASVAETHLLQVLVHKPETCLWLSAPPQEVLGESPLRQLTLALGADQDPALLTHASATAQRLVRVFRATNPLQEIATAFCLVEEALCSGLPASRIALLVANEEIYGKPLRTILSRLQLSANVAIALPLAQTSFGAWLQDLMTLSLDETAITSVLSFMAHPLTLPEDLATDVGHFICTKGALDYSQCLQFAARETSPITQSILAMAERLKPVTLRFATYTLLEWTRIFERLMEHFEISERLEAVDPSLAASCLDAVEGFLIQMEDLATAMNEALPLGELWALTARYLLTRDVRAVGEPMKGLQILSITEARYVPFSLAIVVGCVEGSFPKALPRDRVIDQFFRGRLGLPGWQDLERLEDTTFSLLRHRIPELVLLYPDLQDDVPTCRSRFIERLCSEGLCSVERVRLSPPELLPKVFGYQRHDSSEILGDCHPKQVQGAYPAADRAELLSPMSATAVERLIRCPYQFLLRRLGVQDLLLPDADDPGREGAWLHAVIETFFTGQTAGRQVISPLDTKIGLEEFRSYAVSRLILISQKLAPKTAQKTPRFVHVLKFSWPALVEFLIRIWQCQGDFVPDRGFHELSLSHGPTHDSNFEEEKIRGSHVLVGDDATSITGAIDSVQMIGASALITDFKRSGGPKPAEVASGLAPQLPFYALALAGIVAPDPLAGRFTPTRSVVGYWDIFNGRWITCGVGSEAKQDAMAAGIITARSKSKTTESISERTLTLWRWRKAEIMSPQKSLSPDSSDCGFCRLVVACRRDDPAWRDRFADNMALADKLADLAQSPEVALERN